MNVGEGSLTVCEFHVIMCGAGPTSFQGKPTKVWTAKLAYGPSGPLFFLADLETAWAELIGKGGEICG
jgi:hypothetical protein